MAHITGKYNLANFGIYPYCKAEFHLSAVDTDADAAYIPDAVSVVIGSDGSIDAELWENDNGSRGTVYTNHVVVYADSSYQREVKRIGMGKIVVIGDAEIQDLLVTNVVLSTQENALALAQAAAASAADDAEVAEAARDEAEAARDAAVAAAEFRAPSMSNFLSRSDVTIVGSRWRVDTGEVLDVVASGTGDYDHPVSGLGLSVVPVDGSVSLSAFGAPNNNTTDITPLIALAMAKDADIVFPTVFAVANTVQFYGSRRNFHFPNSRITILPGGTFKDVITYGSNADTGKNVVLSIGDSVSGCNWCHFTGSLAVANNNSGATNLVLWAAEKLGYSYQNRFLLVNVCSRAGFDYVFYGQGTTVPVPGSFTGSYIAHIESDAGSACFYFTTNQDDISLGTVRDRGNSFASSDVVILSYFLFGKGSSDGTGVVTTNTNDGVTLGSFASIVISHLFVEGGFRYPVLLNGANNQIIVHSLRVSSNFSSQYGYVFECNTDNCHIKITEDIKSLQGGHLGYIDRYAVTSNGGLFEVDLTARRGASNYKSPIQYRSGAASTLDTVLVREPKVGEMRGYFSGSSLTWRQLNVKDASRRDESDAVISYLGTAGETTVSVTDQQRLALYTQNCNVLHLSASTAVQVYTYGALPENKGLEITIFASGAGNVQLVSDATGTIKFASGASSITLLANRANSVTLKWSSAASAWLETSRVTY